MLIAIVLALAAVLARPACILGRAALRRLHDHGYCLVVVTNQSGVARGLYSERDLARVH
ncbi:MAG: hypothetical protein IAG13_30700, partial [Deltaproteobacteria bacterium]|nr:hypothetical protein [Nannocystaceae bacterium]